MEPSKLSCESVAIDPCGWACDGRKGAAYGETRDSDFDELMMESACIPSSKPLMDSLRGTHALIYELSRARRTFADETD